MVRAPRFQAVLVLAGSGLLSASCGGAGDRSPVHPSPSTTAAATIEETIGRNFVDELARGDWRHTKTEFSPEMSEAMPSAKVREAWQKLEGLAGRYRAITSATVESMAAG